ncbi:MAG: chemoreceptor glutamine deamidase CheD [Rickettsiales bacterium]
MLGRRSSDIPISRTADGSVIIERRGADRDNSVEVVKLISGDYYVTNKPNQMIVTILGSCVAACMRDPVLKIGGMNHFLLPATEDQSVRDSSESARYGAYAMEQVINGIIKLGGHKNRLEVKVFGGGNVINSSAMIGSRNVAFVRKFLKDEGLKIANEDLGDTYPRRLRYYPDTGKVMLMKLRRKEDMAVINEEKKFVSTLKSKPIEGDIELF